jgi:hypothetical protein
MKPRLTADQRDQLDALMSKSFQVGQAIIRLKSYRQLSTGFISVITSKQTFTFLASEFDDFMAKVAKWQPIDTRLEPEANNVLLQQFSCLEEELNQVIRETAGYEFRISFDGIESKAYLVRSKKIFTGTLRQVLHQVIDELRTYRTPNAGFTLFGSLRKGNQKEFVYWKR